ncbi:MAG: hypothetical protein KDC53_09035 [Saprospiraceae bacterium]|nr:hypothetical protein [Saprospiraceae bacterium]
MTLMIFWTFDAASQNVLSLSPGASGGALGAIRSTKTDVMALYGNQAGLASLVSPGFYVTAERRFNNEGLNFYSAVGGLPTQYGNFGLSIYYHGFAEFNEQLVGLTYARRLLDQLSIGTRLDYIQASIPAYGNTSAITAEFGMQTVITSGILVGFSIYNPFEINWAEGEGLPTILNIGVAYQPTDKLWISGEIEKVSDFRENVKWGLEYLYQDNFAFRVGFNTNPGLVTFGIGYSLNSGLACDISSSVHQALGLSPMAGIGYLAKNK